MTWPGRAGATSEKPFPPSATAGACIDGQDRGPARATT